MYDPATLWAKTIGHADWRMPNMGFDASGEVTAVFDWDSLEYCSESWTVGVAASNFSSGAAGDPNESRPPNLQMSTQFIGYYEGARRRRFSAAERKAIAGALLYALSA